MNDVKLKCDQLAAVSQQLAEVARKLLGHRKHDCVSGSSGAQLLPSGTQTAAAEISDSFSGNSSSLLHFIIIIFLF